MPSFYSNSGRTAVFPVLWANIATHYLPGKGLTLGVRLPPMRLSVVVPCFNEAGNIAGVVGQAAQVGRTLASELEIVVVDDGSTDGTAEVLKALQSVNDRRSELGAVSNRLSSSAEFVALKNQNNQEAEAR